MYIEGVKPEVVPVTLRYRSDVSGLHIQDKGSHATINLPPINIRIHDH